MTEPQSPAKYGTLLFCLSYRCNIRCDVCSVGDRLESPDFLPVLDAKRVVDQCQALGYTRNLGFTGGEPFLQYKSMLEILRHAHAAYGWRGNITTNCTWAKTLSVARARLKPLVETGLDALLISVDDSHLKHVTLEVVGNAIRAAREHGVFCQIQSVILNGSRTSEDFQELLDEFSSDPGVIWRDSRCVPMGSAVNFAQNKLIMTPGVMMGGCTIFKFIAVMPNGDVGLCCSFFPDSLVVGNVHRDPIEAILRTAEKDELSQAVFLWGGPKLVADLLKDEGMPAYSRRSYTNVCHACHEILSDKTAVAHARRALSSRRDELKDLVKEAQSNWAYLRPRSDQKKLWNR